VAVRVAGVMVRGPWPLSGQAPSSVVTDRRRTLLGSYSIPRRYAVVAALRTSRDFRVAAFAACGSPLDLALRARRWRFSNAQAWQVCSVQ